MSKLVAMLACVVALFGISLGNFWFTYGLWPQNWKAWTVFMLLTMLVQALIVGISREK